MADISLSPDITVDPAQIASVQLDEKGAKISSNVVSVSSGDWADLTVPEDTLIVRLKNGSEFVIRGAEATKHAWDALNQAKQGHQLSFEASVNKRE